MILWPFILTSVNSTCPLVTSRNPKHIWFLSQDHSNCTEQTAILHWTGKGLSAYSKIKFMMCKEIAKDAFHTPQLPHFSQSYPKYLSWILHCYLLAPTHTVCLVGECGKLASFPWSVAADSCRTEQAWSFILGNWNCPVPWASVLNLSHWLQSQATSSGSILLYLPAGRLIVWLFICEGVV